LTSAGDIDELHLGGHLVAGLDQGRKSVESFIGNRNDADIGFNGAKGVVFRGNGRGGQGIKDGRLAHVGQTDNSTAKSHVILEINGGTNTDPETMRGACLLPLLVFRVYSSCSDRQNRCSVIHYLEDFVQAVMKFDLLVTNCVILPVPGTERLISPGYVAIKGSRIVQVGSMDHCPQGDTGTVVDGQGQLAMPGLVNGHCHAPMTLFRGLADDLDLATWLQHHIFPAEAAMVSPEMVYWCGKLAAAEMLLSGTTTVADGYFFEDEVARACAEVGLRCVAGQAVIDFPAPGAEDPACNIEVAERFLERWQGRDPLVTPAVFAHSPYTCGNRTLLRAKALARRYRVPLFIHSAETGSEQAQIAEPLGRTPIEHLSALDLLDRDTVCVHCVWADAPDIDRLRKSGAAVITCPQSNAKLASGRAPLPLMLEQWCRLGLGTDGAASNNSLDLFREMGFAARLHKVNQADRRSCRPGTSWPWPPTMVPKPWGWPRDWGGLTGRARGYGAGGSATAAPAAPSQRQPALCTAAVGRCAHGHCQWAGDCGGSRASNHGSAETCAQVRRWPVARCVFPWILPRPVDRCHSCSRRKGCCAAVVSGCSSCFGSWFSCRPPGPMKGKGGVRVETFPASSFFLFKE
jgi:5-methylthioadenosine/S-adenosylhomocysteine deaminase